MPEVGEAACRADVPAPDRRRARRRHHDHRATDRLVLPALLVVALVTTRFAVARARLAQDGWESAYRLSSGRQWWRCLRFASSQGELHRCAERLAKHLSWHLDDQVSLTDIRSVLGSYAAYHHLSARTAWADWARLVAGRRPGHRPTKAAAGRRGRVAVGRPATCSLPPLPWSPSCGRDHVDRWTLHSIPLLL